MDDEQEGRRREGGREGTSKVGCEPHGIRSEAGRKEIF